MAKAQNEMLYAQNKMSLVQYEIVNAHIIMTNAQNEMMYSPNKINVVSTKRYSKWTILKNVQNKMMFLQTNVVYTKQLSKCTERKDKYHQKAAMAFHKYTLVYSLF